MTVSAHRFRVQRSGLSSRHDMELALQVRAHESTVQTCPAYSRRVCSESTISEPEPVGAEPMQDA